MSSGLCKVLQTNSLSHYLSVAARIKGSHGYFSRGLVNLSDIDRRRTINHNPDFTRSFMSSPQQNLDRLFISNAQWAKDVQRLEPGFLEQSATGQSPHTLWIGCADSRVPETTITGAKPGEIFVHRNIANQFHVEDSSALAVLTYAVDFLGVKQVVVVGHSECGGALACLGAAQAGNDATIPSLPTDAPLNRWLAPLTQLSCALNLKDALSLVEANVKQQVENLCKSETIINAWKSKDPVKRNLRVHGWVYDLASGTLRDLNVSRGARDA